MQWIMDTNQPAIDIDSEIPVEFLIQLKSLSFLCFNLQFAEIFFPFSISTASKFRTLNSPLSSKDSEWNCHAMESFVFTSPN